VYAYEGDGVGVLASTRRGVKIDRGEMRTFAPVFQRSFPGAGYFPDYDRAAGTVSVSP
jgi:hypothetical protein